MTLRLICVFSLLSSALVSLTPADAQQPAAEDFSPYGIYRRSAPRADATTARSTALPLKLAPGARIALIGNTLLERSQHFGQLEALLHQQHPKHQLVVRNLAWPGDTPDLQPRPDNFADLHQHLTHEKVDVIVAAFGFNESFDGDAGAAHFREALTELVRKMRSSAYNGATAPQVVLLSPIASENVEGVNAADLNNARIKQYADIVRQVAKAEQVGFVDVFTPTLAAMRSPGTELTFNGVHLTEQGYDLLAGELFQGLFAKAPPAAVPALRAAIVDKNRQYNRRYRPLNTFYYTGGRSKSYGYLDFLPAMRNFDLMTANRDQRIWKIAQGKKVPPQVDDANVPPLPKTTESRGANAWMSAADEKKAFKIDPRFNVDLFAGEEEFPDIAAPIQMRWDTQGRLWVACSTTYPHVYPGNEPNDKLVILEDTNGDGKADKSSVFAEDLNIPLSFEFGDGGVYVSEMPHLTFLKDTTGDGKADQRRILMTGFGVEDSHHSLHDFVWTPDGDLLFRESIFHHSQVETPYGPVRQQNSGWFRYEPRTHRLTSFGSYHSTNPWGVTFDDWGQHVASHPVYAAAFHALDPPYPAQHPRPVGLTAYSGTAGQEFVDFPTFPQEMQGGYIKARYKPTNRVEFHRWKENGFGYDEEYVSDVIFSTNLSFIPVDIRFGPRGALYLCDWYNPVKGHAQYSLRDERRDRHSGRIWRITTKGKPLVDAPKIAGAPIADLLALLKSPQYRYRYWAKRELRERDPAQVKPVLDAWVQALTKDDPRRRHHQLEAIWLYRTIDAVNTDLLRELLQCEEHHARAAATEQLSFWHPHLDDSAALLKSAANDPSGLVRMQAVMAATYVGDQAALEAVLDTFKHPRDGHLAYAINCALGSRTLKPIWEANPQYKVASLLKMSRSPNEFREPKPTAEQAAFDAQEDLKTVRISCIPERMRYNVAQFSMLTGQPLKIVFANPDATDHNLVVVKPGALEEVGMAANAMAKDPQFANSDFIPEEKRHLILEASPMIGPTRKSKVHVLRFTAPTEPGVYPFVCTFPGHWVVMYGEIVIVDDLADADALLAARQPRMVKAWKLADFAETEEPTGEQAVMRGMQAFVKARCNQCHVVGGHGVALGPELTHVAKCFPGEKLLQQIIEPSAAIHEKYQTYRLLMNNGRIISGVIVKEDATNYHVVGNLLTPNVVVKARKKQVDEQIISRISPMPEGLVNVLTKEEILNLAAFLRASGYQAPDHLKHKHHPHAEPEK